MDAREMEGLVQRLLRNPHDEEALTHAHRAGQSDPRSYAMLLEKVGTASVDPSLASYWLTEAADVWSATLLDAHRAARALMIAIDRDPSQSIAADRLAELYRANGDRKALAALLERRVKSLAPLVDSDSELATQLSTLHEELGRLWSEPPLSQPQKAIDHHKRAIEYDPTSQYAIYAVRELYKSLEQWTEALPYFELEQRLIPDDLQRKIALFEDEADVRKHAGDRLGATAAYKSALLCDGGQDAGLKQLFASAVLERVQLGENLSQGELAEAVQLFNELAEQFPGEYGYSYAICALDLDPGNDRAMQLGLHYAAELSCEDDIALKAAAYVRANPHGSVSGEAAQLASRHLHEEEANESLADGDRTVVERMPDFVTRIQPLLESAEALVRRGKKHEAATTYKTVLDIDPEQTDAMAFLDAHLRAARKYSELREVLLAVARHPRARAERRAACLREIAALCESQLRDLEGAISAWQEAVSLQPEDGSARAQLRRLLERAAKWDDLAGLLEREAEREPNVEQRLVQLKALAKLHEQKRRDARASGATWATIARLAPSDESAIWTSVKHFDRAECPDLAARVIADTVDAVSEPRVRIQLLRRLGELREKLGDAAAAGEAFLQAAELTKEPASWDAAERCFVAAGAWDRAAAAIDAHGRGVTKPRERAVLLARQASYLVSAGREPAAIACLETACDLDPSVAEYAEALETRYGAAGRIADLVVFLQKRANRAADVVERVRLRKRAAQLLQNELGDVDGARECLRAMLEEHDDEEALRELALDAEQRGDFEHAVDYLARLRALVPDRLEKSELLQREARISAEGLGDAERAIARYEELLQTSDASNLLALTALAALHESRADLESTARVFERYLEIVPDLAIARRLASIYETELGRSADAVRILDLVRELDPADVAVLERVCQLCEELEDWPRVAEHLSRLIELEKDEAEALRLTRRLAEILHQHLDKSDEALAVLLDSGDRGDESARSDYVQLADELGWKGIAATKLLDWYGEAPAGKQRQQALHGAFDRFLEVGRHADAARVGREIALGPGPELGFADRLERLSVGLRDLDTLSMAHELLVRDLSGIARAEEMVRQAEVLVECGLAPEEALTHGELALASAAPGDVETLLGRLGQLATAADQVVDLYERQVTRCRSPADRLRALARAAQVASEYSAFARARTFFDVALGSGVPGDSVAVLEDAASSADLERGNSELTRTLAQSLSEAGRGVRDGGKTHSVFLRRAAQLAYERLRDEERALAWLGDALVAHVDDEALDALENVANELGQPKRAEAVLTRALDEVSDGPLVRKLLARRAQMRSEQLEDPRGAAEDLKKLHELAPQDAQVIARLKALYEELGDQRGMVRLYEDQILRGKDPSTRVELARKVARLWEEDLDDPREAADAWRRVLRMKNGDAEATQGLERAKARMLQRSSAKSEAAASQPGIVTRTPESADGKLRSSPPAAAALNGPEDDPGYGEQEEVTKTASLQELEARSIASSPRPVQLTPVSLRKHLDDFEDSDDASDEELNVDEQELLDGEDRE